MRVSGRMIVTAFKTDGKPSIQLDQEQAIPVRELDAPAHLRRNTLSWCRSAAFSASSRRFDLNGATNTVRNKHSRAIIAADVMRFGHLIKRTEFSVYTAVESSLPPAQTNL